HDDEPRPCRCAHHAEHTAARCICRSAHLSTPTQIWLEFGGFRRIRVRQPACFGRTYRGHTLRKGDREPCVWSAPFCCWPPSCRSSPSPTPPPRSSPSAAIRELIPTTSGSRRSPRD